MKWILLFVMPLAMATNPKIDKEKCTCNGHPLYGRVQVVDSYPDFDVKIVDSYPDLDVKIVESYPDKCGLWKFVDSNPDFKIRFVDSYPDISIRYVDSYPGF